jgi:hypothetical protein
MYQIIRAGVVLLATTMALAPGAAQAKFREVDVDHLAASAYRVASDETAVLLGISGNKGKRYLEKAIRDLENDTRRVSSDKSAIAKVPELSNLIRHAEEMLAAAKASGTKMDLGRLVKLAEAIDREHAAALAAGRKAGLLSELPKLERLASDSELIVARLATHGLFESAGAKMSFAMRFKQDLATVKANFDQIAASPLSNAAIKNALQLAQNQLTFFDNAADGMTKRMGDREASQSLLTSMERMLEALDDLTDEIDGAIKALIQ